jgi:hypothetical protein
MHNKNTFYVDKKSKERPIQKKNFAQRHTWTKNPKKVEVHTCVHAHTLKEITALGRDFFSLQTTTFFGWCRLCGGMFLCVFVARTDSKCAHAKIGVARVVSPLLRRTPPRSLLPKKTPLLGLTKLPIHQLAHPPPRSVKTVTNTRIAKQLSSPEWVPVARVVPNEATIDAAIVVLRGADDEKSPKDLPAKKLDMPPLWNAWYSSCCQVLHYIGDSGALNGKCLKCGNTKGCYVRPRPGRGVKEAPLFVLRLADGEYFPPSFSRLVAFVSVRTG